MENADVEAVLQRVETNWQLTLLAGSLYVDNVQLTTETIQLSFGDELSFGNVFFKFFGDEVWVKGPVTVTQELIEKTESNHTFYEEYPDYHRSPRIITEVRKTRLLLMRQLKSLINRKMGFCA